MYTRSVCAGDPTRHTWIRTQSYPDWRRAVTRRLQSMQSDWLTHCRNYSVHDAVKRSSSLAVYTSADQLYDTVAASVLEVCGNEFFTHITSHSSGPIPIPVSFPLLLIFIAIAVDFTNRITRFLPWNFPHFITLYLNCSPNQIRHVQATHYTTSPLNTQNKPHPEGQEFSLNFLATFLSRHCPAWAPLPGPFWCDPSLITPTYKAFHCQWALSPREAPSVGRFGVVRVGSAHYDGLENTTYRTVSGFSKLATRQ